MRGIRRIKNYGGRAKVASLVSGENKRVGLRVS